ncbi:MAG TPA: hypothetical protein V6C89_02650 [Drouetiella sp.]|jgi:hypothetical protein
MKKVQLRFANKEKLKVIEPVPCPGIETSAAPSVDNAITESVDTTKTTLERVDSSDKECAATNRKSRSKLAQEIVIHKSFPLIMGIVIASTLAGRAYFEMTRNEDNLQKHRAAAELLDYAQKPETACLMWHKAIEDAKNLNFKEKLTADMYAKAARSERQYTRDVWEKFPVLRSERAEVQRTRAIVKAYYQKEEDDLKAALKLYERIPDTRAEQLIALEHLQQRLENKLKEIPPGLNYTAAFTPRNKQGDFFFEDPTSSNKDLIQGLKDLLSSKSDSGLASFQRYLRQERDSRQLHASVLDKVYATKKNDYKTLQLLIPIVHELIYYNQDIYTLRDEYECLDYILSSFMNPTNFNDRLNLAESSKTTHGQIIEYMRCLGIQNDENIRSKLIAKIVEARKTDLTAEEQTKIADYVDCVKKTRTISLEAFGKGHRTTQVATEILGFEEAVKGNFAEAEALLNPIQSQLTSDNFDEATTIYDIAEVYASQGKFDLALATYKRGQKLDQQRMPRDGIWQAIARINLVAGHIEEADKAIAQLNNESTLYGSSLSGSGVDSLLIE